LKLDCLEAEGTVEIELTEYDDEKSFEIDLFTYACGNTAQITFVTSKGCRVTQNRTVTELNGSQFRFELQVDCTEGALAQGNILLISHIRSDIHYSRLTFETGSTGKRENNFFTVDPVYFLKRFLGRVLTDSII
jgi:hypothetical protein